MQKTKRIFAIIGVILLAALYCSTLVFAIFDRSETMVLLQASIFATIVIPVLIYAYTLVYRHLKK